MGHRPQSLSLRAHSDHATVTYYVSTFRPQRLDKILDPHLDFECGNCK